MRSMGWSKPLTNWWRNRRRGQGASTGSDVATAAGAASADGGADPGFLALAPLAATTRPVVPTVQRDATTWVGTWRPPTFMTGVDHLLDPAAPAGVVPDLARPSAPVTRPGGPIDLPLAPPDSSDLLEQAERGGQGATTAAAGDAVTSAASSAAGPVRAGMSPGSGVVRGENSAAGSRPAGAAPDRRGAGTGSGLRASIQRLVGNSRPGTAAASPARRASAEGPGGVASPGPSAAAASVSGATATAMAASAEVGAPAGRPVAGLPVDGSPDGGGSLVGGGADPHPDHRKRANRIRANRIRANRMPGHSVPARADDAGPATPALPLRRLPAVAGPAPRALATPALPEPAPRLLEVRRARDSQTSHNPGRQAAPESTGGLDRWPESTGAPEPTVQRESAQLHLTTDKSGAAEAGVPLPTPPIVPEHRTPFGATRSAPPARAR